VTFRDGVFEISYTLKPMGTLQPSLCAQDPETRQVVELSKDFNTGELAYDFESADPYFQRAVIVAEYAEILKKSYWAEESSSPCLSRSDPVVNCCRGR
jgi:hypothetical protein